MNDFLKIALSQVGVTEIPGKDSNNVIVNYSVESGIKGISNDDIPWCSTFVNWCAYKTGMERTHLPNARSWLDVGEKTNHPEPGDIVVFWRESPQSWKGHVGIFCSIHGEYIYCLGGNQNNRVKISRYPLSEKLGYRKLRKDEKTT